VHVPRSSSRRGVLAIVAVGSLAALTLPAGATTRTTTTTTPSHGSASSALSILRLTLNGQTVTAGRISAVAGNSRSPHTARLVLTPLDSTATGPVGQQEVTPSSPTTVPGTPKSITLPGGFGSVTGPTFVAQAKDATSGVLATARLSAIGSVNLTAVPLSVDLNAASLQDTAQVVSSHASAVKSVSVGNLALPSLADLFAALGVDLPALLDQLTQGKLTQLAGLVTDTTSGAVKAANDAVDTAQAALTSAGETNVADTVADAQAELTAADAQLTQDNSAFDSAWSAAYSAAQTAGTNGAIDTALTSAGFTNPPSADQFNTLTAAEKTAIQTVLDAIDTTLYPAMVTASDAVAADENIVALVNDLINALQQLVTSVVGAIDGNNEPLAAVKGISVTTKAMAARTPSAAASVHVASIDVLGQAKQLSTVSAALAQVGATLASVLDSVPGVKFTPPSISAGTPSKSTSTKGRTRYATASIRALTLHLPTITLPAALGVGGVVPTKVSGTLVLGEVVERAQWTPSLTHTTTTTTPGAGNGPALSETGGRVLLPTVASLLIVAAALVRRRWVHE